MYASLMLNQKFIKANLSFKIATSKNDGIIIDIVLWPLSVLILFDLFILIILIILIFNL